MLSKAINWGRVETEEKKVLNVFRLQKFLAIVLNTVQIMAEVQNMISKVDLVLCSRNDGFKLKLQSLTFIFKFKKKKKKNQLSEFKFQVQSLC